MLHRITGRRAVNGVHMDELAAALAELGRAPVQALRHPTLRDRPHARDEIRKRLFADVPFEVRAVTLGTFLDAAPPGAWAIATSGHVVAYGDGLVADSAWFFSRRPAPWSRDNPDHARVALRRIAEAVRFAPVSRQREG